MKKGRQNMARRSLLEIYFDVLEAIDKGVDDPTRIIFTSDLSWASLCGVFDTLLNNGFIREEKGKTSNKFCITKKGKNALSYHLKSVEGHIQSKLK